MNESTFSSSPAFVIAIEIGSSTSGYAYSSSSHFSNDPLKIGSFLWSTTDGSLRSLKTSTSILFDKDGKFDSYGFGAEDRYNQLISEGQSEQWYYYHKFNSDEKVFQSEAVICDFTGKKGLPAQQIFTSAIKYLKNHAQKKLGNILSTLKEEQLNWVLIDHDLQNEKFLLNAALKAGLRSNVFIISKTEAFMCYFEQSLKCRGRTFRPCGNYAIINATEKKIQITAKHCKTQTKLLEKTNRNLGGEDVDTAILDHLWKLRKNKESDKVLESKEQKAVHRKIENRKRAKSRELVSNSDTPNTEKTTVDVSHRDCTGNESVKNQVDDELFVKLSIESADKVASYVFQTLHDPTCGVITDIIMIGGYSDSEYLQTAIQRRFVGINLHIPREPVMAELKGAVIFGHTKYDAGKRFVSQTMIKRYLSHLDEVKQTIRNIRLIVVGAQGVGKTSLCGMLMNKKFTLPDKATEDSLYVLIKHFVIDMSIAEIESTLNTENDPILHRLTTMFLNQPYDIASKQDVDFPAEVKQNQNTVKEDAKCGNEDETYSESKQARDDKAYLSMWDFKGLKVLYNTHHIFLNSDAVYLIVFNLVQCISNKANIDDLLYWIRSVGTYCQERREDCIVSTPPIILVGTHRSKIPGTDAEKDFKINELEEYICELPDLLAMKDHIYGFFEVDEDIQDDSEVKELWQAIVAVAPAQSQWERQLPARWLFLEQEIHKKKQLGMKVMALNELSKLASKCGMNTEAKEQLHYFLRYMHFCGAILYFHDEMLQAVSDWIILNPQWLVHAFTSLTTAPITLQVRNRRLDFLWKLYKMTAMLGMEYVENVWKGDNELNKHRDILLAYMEKLGLFATPRCEEARRKSIACKYSRSFFVPSMLPDRNYSVIKKEIFQRHIVRTRTLCLVFTSMFVPIQIFDKLMAACIEQFELKKSDGQHIVGRGFGVFKVDSLWNFIVFCSQNKIKLTIYKQSPEDKIEPGAGLKVRLFVESTLQNILAMYQQNTTSLRYEFHLHCKPYNAQHYLTTPVSDIEARRTQSCCTGLKQHFLMKRDLDPWFTETQIEEKKDEIDSDICGLPSEILDRCPTQKELMSICKCMGVDYQFFFIELGLSLSDIQQVELQHQSLTPPTKFMYMFDKWIHRRKDSKKEATIRHIVQSMVNQEMDVASVEDIFE